MRTPCDRAEAMLAALASCRGGTTAGFPASERTDLSCPREVSDCEIFALSMKEPPSNFLLEGDDITTLAPLAAAEFTRFVRGVLRDNWAVACSAAFCADDAAFAISFICSF